MYPRLLPGWNALTGMTMTDLEGRAGEWDASGARATSLVTCCPTEQISQKCENVFLANSSCPTHLNCIETDNVCISNTLAPPLRCQLHSEPTASAASNDCGGRTPAVFVLAGAVEFCEAACQPVRDDQNTMRTGLIICSALLSVAAFAYVLSTTNALEGVDISAGRRCRKRQQLPAQQQPVD